jgi:hypothetical protein
MHFYVSFCLCETFLLQHEMLGVNGLPEVVGNELVGAMPELLPHLTHEPSISPTLIQPPKTMTSKLLLHDATQGDVGVAFTYILL